MKRKVSLISYFTFFLDPFEGTMKSFFEMIFHIFSAFLYLEHQFPKKEDHSVVSASKPVRIFHIINTAEDSGKVKLNIVAKIFQHGQTPIYKQILFSKSSDQLFRNQLFRCYPHKQ